MEKAWLALGVALREDGEFLRPLRCFDRVISMDPRSEKAYYNKALLLIKYGIRKDALMVIDEGLSVNEKALILLLTKAGILREMGEFGAALETYDRALAINPEYKVTLYERQKCVEMMEKRRRKR